MTTTRPAAISRVVRALLASSRPAALLNWRKAVAARTCTDRPDLAPALTSLLGVGSEKNNILAGLSVGEIGICYEALLATLDRGKRRSAGQFFTPDDASEFMAARSTDFPTGTWLDPACGVGNLSWHVAAAQDDPAEFVRERLVLIDKDETALLTAVAIIAADFAAPGDTGAVVKLHERAQVRDFLSRDPLPAFDFAILNPPYAHAAPKPGYATGATKDLFAYFLERVARESTGFIAVTPASFVSIPKFASLRNCLNSRAPGGDVYVFDNVPDTLFRGFKFGSYNTSTTNFVRAAITVANPSYQAWRITPILRWAAASRERMFARAHELLSPRRIGPHGEWVKVPPSLLPLWDAMSEAPTTLGDLVVRGPTEHSLTIATTPRYYISASFRDLDRTSKTVLYFDSRADQERAALVLNSSLTYLWWRALDGGVSLPKRVLLSVPVPAIVGDVCALAELLEHSEERSVVTKLNAGRVNENIKHSPEVTAAVDAAVIPGAPDLALVYAPDMFARD